MSNDERLAYFAGLWAKRGAHFDAGWSSCRYWLDQLAAGRYLGLPVEESRVTSDGRYGYQAFGAGFLHWPIGDWTISEGLPPFA